MPDDAPGRQLEGATATTADEAVLKLYNETFAACEQAAGLEGGSDTGSNNVLVTHIWEDHHANMITPPLLRTAENIANRLRIREEEINTVLDVMAGKTADSPGEFLYADKGYIPV